MASSYRQCTIKLTFPTDQERPKAYEIERFIREEMRLPPQDVIGIHFSILSPTVYIKMTNEEKCSEAVQRHVNGLKFRYSDGHIGTVEVDHAGFGLRTLRVFELPFELPSDVVVAAFQPYGNVISHVAETWKTFETYRVFNGVRQIKIQLRKHVPSYLVIAGCRAVVMYDGQPRTCSGCGQEGHVRSECLRRRLVQTPIGEEARPAAPTVLPLTYASPIVASPTPNPNQSAPALTPQDDAMAAAAVPPTSTPETVPKGDGNQQQQDVRPDLMDVDTAAVQTSNVMQSDRMSDDSRPPSDTDQHLRKQRSPKKRKRPRRTSSEETDKDQDSSTENAPALDDETSTPAIESNQEPPKDPSPPPSDVVAPLPGCATTSVHTNEHVPFTNPIDTSISWADETEAAERGSGGVEGGGTSFMTSPQSQ